MTPLSWLKNAFALDASPGSEVSPEVDALLNRLICEVMRRKLEVPALMLLEMGRPLGNLSAQVLHFVQPIAGCLFNANELQFWASFLERSDALKLLADRLESQARPSYCMQTSHPANSPEPACLAESLSEGSRMDN